MAPRILLTTTSFLDTPGGHHDYLQQVGLEVVTARGPLDEVALLQQIGDGNQFDGFLCGEDQFTSTVIRALAPRGRIISKYGVGLDRIDLETAKELGIQVTNTPGVNHATVAEHTFGLLLSLARKIPEENAIVHRREWKRFTGVELSNKTLGVFGFGRVGMEVARKAMGFGMKILVFNTSWSTNHQQFLQELNRVFSDPFFGTDHPTAERCVDDDEALSRCDFVTLHMNLTKTNQSYLNRRRIGLLKRGAIVINVSRGALVDQNAMAYAVRNGQLAGYGADVLDPEPPTPDNPLIGLNNVHLTPHIGSRTRESVERQGKAAIENIVKALSATSSTLTQPNVAAPTTEAPIVGMPVVESAVK